MDEKGYTFQLLFIDIQPTIKIPLYKENYYDITQYDTNLTKYRKRYTFINANFFSIQINGSYFTLPSIAPKLKSYQFAVYNLKEKLIVRRPLLLDEEENLFQIYNVYYSFSCIFKDEAQDIINNGKYKEIISCIKKYVKLGFIF